MRDERQQQDREKEQQPFDVGWPEWRQNYSCERDTNKWSACLAFVMKAAEEKKKKKKKQDVEDADADDDHYADDDGDDERNSNINPRKDDHFFVNST